MEDSISLKQALGIINQKDKSGNAFPFDISVRTLNRNSKTGGKLNSYKGAKLLINENSKKGDQSKLLDNVLVGSKFKKDPNHWSNRTRNLKVAEESRPRKIHIRLIDSINNKKVVY